MKMSKLSIIAMLAISFGFFSCNKEESLIISQNSNGELKDITKTTLEQDTIENVVELIITPSREKIEPRGGNSYLSGVLQITYPDGHTTSGELTNMVYTGSANGFELRGSTITAYPIESMNIPGRSIDITGRGTYEGKTYEGYVTVHQEGTAAVIAGIGGVEYKGDQHIELAPGTYPCYAGYYGIGYAKETWVTKIEGPGVWAEMPHGPLHVSSNADARVTLKAILPGLPTIRLHITAK